MKYPHLHEIWIYSLCLTISNEKYQIKKIAYETYPSPEWMRYFGITEI